MSTQETISVVALGPENDEERSQWLEALGRVIDSNAYCLGREVEAFEQQVSRTTYATDAAALEPFLEQIGTEAEEEDEADGGDEEEPEPAAELAEELPGAEEDAP